MRDNGISMLMEYVLIPFGVIIYTWRAAWKFRRLAMKVYIIAGIIIEQSHVFFRYPPVTKSPAGCEQISLYEFMDGKRGLKLKLW